MGEAAHPIPLETQPRCLYLRVWPPRAYIALLLPMVRLAHPWCVSSNNNSGIKAKCMCSHGLLLLSRLFSKFSVVLASLMLITGWERVWGNDADGCAATHPDLWRA